VEAHNNILNSDRDRAEIAVAGAKADRAALDIEYAEKKRLHGDSKEAAIVIEEWYSAKLKEIEKKRTDDSRGALKKWSDTHKEFIDICEETVVHANESFASGLTNALFDFIDGTKTAKEAFYDFARSFLSEIAKMIVQQTILNALKQSMSTTNEKEGWAKLAISAAMSAYGGTATTGATGATSGSTVTAGQANAWTGSAGSSTAVAGWAKGGLFESGIVKAFAKGGVYNRPTVFPMANGMGLMGEAGPEAVMPLRRSAKGELGVVATNAKEDESRKKKETIKVEIANIVSPELLDSYMATSRGQNAILNVISNKPGMVRRILQAG
jgi:lambda family phage tail tape measure protein